MCRNNKFISEGEYVNRYVRQVIPYEGFVKGKGYACFWYDTVFPTTRNPSGRMFWDRYAATVLVQAIDSSAYMKELSWNVSVEDVTKQLVRQNPDGTTTVSLGINKEVTLSKQYGKYKVSLEDTGSEVNVRVAVEDAVYENGVKTKETALSTNCRLKDFHTVFDPVGSYSLSGMGLMERGGGSAQDEFTAMDAANLGLSLLSTINTYESGYLKYNELWHKTKTRGVSWSFQSKWKNPGAKYWRQQQVKPFEGARKAGKIINKAGKSFFVADVIMSGELKPSQLINGGMLMASGTGIGSVVAVVWFIADFGTMGVNYIIGNGAISLGDMLDNAVGTYEMYEGLY
jgi:hypothetical protein